MQDDSLRSRLMLAFDQKNNASDCAAAEVPLQTWMLLATTSRWTILMQLVGMLRIMRLLIIPDEIHPPSVVRQGRMLLRQNQKANRAAPHPFFRLAADPTLNRLHIDMLSSRAPQNPQMLENILNVALVGGPDRLSSQERMALASDAKAVRTLHEQSWAHWSLELLNAAQIGFASKRKMTATL